MNIPFKSDFSSKAAVYQVEAFGPSKDEVKTQSDCLVFHPKRFFQSDHIGPTL